jgi:6,7-dimethyl-8-ribityllumazine synthase
VRTFRGTPEGAGRRVAIVAARFNELVVGKLVDGATAALRRSGVDEAHVDLAWVPGAFELPLVARTMAASGRYDAVICLGAVIRGETPHFDHVAAQAAAGIREAAVATSVPVAFGVLTTDDLAQAMDRAGGRHGNKGWDAALAALETCSVLERIGKADGGSGP